MTEVIEHTTAGGAGHGAAGATDGGTPHSPRRSRALVVLLVVVLVAGLASIGLVVSGAASIASPTVTTLSLASGLYQPKAPPGATDDYHCTLVNPHVTQNSYIISSQFFPGSAEDHHAVLALVASVALAAARGNAPTSAGRDGRASGRHRCPTHRSPRFLQHPLAERLGSGPRRRHPAQGDRDPASGRQPGDHAGPLQPAGRRQAGARTRWCSTPCRSRHRCSRCISTWRSPRRTCRARPVSPVRCATGRHRSPTRRSASAGVRRDRERHRGRLRAQSRRTRRSGTRRRASGRIGKSGYIVRVQAHMHLLGRSFTMVLNPGTPQAKTVLDVPNYNFHYQKAYNLRTPIPVHRRRHAPGHLHLRPDAGAGAARLAWHPPTSSPGATGRRTRCASGWPRSRRSCPTPTTRSEETGAGRWPDAADRRRDRSACPPIGGSTRPGAPLHP